MIELSRVNHNTPDISQLELMRRSLEDFLYSEFEIEKAQWNEQFQAIVDFQAEDGTFMLVDSPRIPSDAFFDFCNFPTVLCNSIMMKALLINPEKYGNLLPALKKGLDASGKMGFEGHGYDAIDGMYEFIFAYCNAGLRFFMDKYSDLPVVFVEEVNKALVFVTECINDNNFVHGFNVNYEDKIRNIHRALTHRPIFTYGTLMKGESNHSYVENTDYVGESVIHGYDLFNLGRYPGIRPSMHYDSTVFGEVYIVNDQALARINRLEGEGSLYLLKCADTRIGDFCVVTGVYVYNLTIDENRIFTGSWTHQAIYVAYGSNMENHQMLEVRCKTAKYLGISELKNQRLVFRANRSGKIVATVEDAADSSVPVVLWAIDNQCEATLDRCEGYLSDDFSRCSYLKKEIPIIFNGEISTGIVYVMTNYGDYGKPSDDYYNRILTGYEEHGIDTAPLIKALNESTRK